MPKPKLVKNLLRLESLGILALGIYLYSSLGFSWLMFAFLILSPDISMLGYLFNSKIGAYCYNFFHSYLLAASLAILALLLSNNILLAIAIILFIHIALDRSLGYGLKFASGFKDTHLNHG